MRGKRSKQYRKLMQQYGLHFGFREPYQVLVDAAILQDAARFKMDFVGGLSRALHGQIKLMITQCCMRHLYASEPNDSIVTQHAKGFERRRCNHHELEKPLSSLECIAGVVDPKGSKINKHRYVVACQDEKLRAYLRTIPGVPLIYLKRSVMIMEPMAGVTEDVRDRDERAKFRAGLKGKRKPGGQGNADIQDASGQEHSESADMELLRSGAPTTLSEPSMPPSTSPLKKTRKRGPSGPNPLSMKKPKKRGGQGDMSESNAYEQSRKRSLITAENDTAAGQASRKRTRRHKSGKENKPAPGTTLDAATLNED